MTAPRSTSYWRLVLILALVAAMLIAGDRDYHERRLNASAAVFRSMTDARMEALLLDEARERATIDFETVLLWVLPLTIIVLYGAWQLTGRYLPLPPSSTDGGAE